MKAPTPPCVRCLEQLRRLTLEAIADPLDLPACVLAHRDLNVRVSALLSIATK